MERTRIGSLIGCVLLTGVACASKPSGESRGAGGGAYGSGPLELPPGWTPAALTPSAWYVATSNDYQVNGGTAYWLEHQRNGRDLSQVASWSPQFVTAEWNGGLPTLRFNGANILKLDNWSVPPIGTNAGFTVLAVIRSATPQNAGIAAWWSEWGDGVWANLRSTGGLTLLDYHRLNDGTLTEMYAGNQDLGTGGHVVAWRFSPSTQSVTLAVDGVHAVSTPQPPIGGISPMSLFVGAMSPLPTGLFQGDISELVFVGSDISDEDLQLFTEYARDTWNLAPPSGAGPCVMFDGTPSPATIRCDDGNPATFGDHCSAGSCVGTVPGPGSPKDLSPVAWYHAGDPEVVVTWGGVSTWFDRSPQHRDLLNGYWGRPILVPNGWNGNKPTVAFSGSNALKRNGWTGAPTGLESSFTVLAVLQRCSDTPACNQTSGIVSWWHPGAYGAIAAKLKPSGSTSVLDLYRLDHILATQDSVGTTDVGSGRHVVAWRYQNGVTKLTVNGVTQTQTQSPIGPIPPDWFLMGVASGYPTDLFRGDISELAVIPRSISDTELAMFNDYAQAEWGGLTLCNPGTPGCVGPVRPAVTCVANDAGTLYAIFGYENATAAPVQIPLGPGNQLSVPIEGRAPIVFQPGAHASVFPAKLVNGSASWTLGGTTAQATASSPPCPDLGAGEPPEENDDPAKIVPPAPGTLGVASVTYEEASSNGAPLVQLPVDPDGPLQAQSTPADEDEEETQALIHGDRGGRAVEVVIVNNSDVNITFLDGMAVGAISTQPPSFIRPGSYGTFETRNAHALQGTEGWIAWGMQTSDPSPRPAVTLFWNNPFIGSNDYGHEFANNTNFVIDRVGGENALATVFFIIRRASTQQTNCPRGTMQWIIDNLKKVEPRLTSVDTEPARFFTPVKRSGLGLMAWGQTGCLATEVIGRVARPPALSTDDFITIDVFLDQFEGAVLRGTDKAIRIEVDPREPRFGAGENPAHNAIMDQGGAALIQAGSRIRFSGVVRIDHGHFLEVHPSAPIEAAVSCDSPNPPAHCNPVFDNIFTATSNSFGSEVTVNMGRAKDRACFPITIDGVFGPGFGGLAQGAVTATIDETTGDWKLIVRSGSPFGSMRGQARCVAATGLTDQFTWVGNSVRLPSVSATRSCFITSIEGDWSASGSYVNIDDFDNPPNLVGGGNGRAGVRCMDVDNSAQFGFHIVNPEPFPRITMEPVEFGCYYNQVRGPFWSPPFGASGGSLDMMLQTVGTELRWTARGRGTTDGGVIRCDRLSQ
jgi:hypothetical protein